IDNAHGDRLTFGQMLDTRGTKDGDMDKNVLAAIIRLHETKTLAVIEPFDGSRDFNGRRRIGMTTRCSARSSSATAPWPAARRIQSLRSPLRSAGGIDLEHGGYLCAVGASTDVDLQLSAWRDRLVACRLQGADVQECIAGAVTQFDKAKAL